MSPDIPKSTHPIRLYVFPHPLRPRSQSPQIGSPAVYVCLYVCLCVCISWFVCACVWACSYNGLLHRDVCVIMCLFVPQYGLCVCASTRVCCRSVSGWGSGPPGGTWRAGSQGSCPGNDPPPPRSDRPSFYHWTPLWSLTAQQGRGSQLVGIK